MADPTPRLHATRRRALVTGATGYVGSRLVPLLQSQGFAVRVVTRDRARVEARAWSGNAEVVEGNVMRDDVLDAALDDVDVAYYLVHSMDGRGDFAARDRVLARSFAEAAARAKVPRIVYLGGLHPSHERLSEHLQSRRDVGEILLASGVPTAVLQAAIILGTGSASFEMLRHLSKRLPAMLTPAWVDNRIEPIAIGDVLHYLAAAADLPADVNRTFDIGCGEVLTYRQMLRRVAEIAGWGGRTIVSVPVLTPSLASHWVGLVTPVPAAIARPLVGSLVNEVVTKERDLDTLVPPPAGGAASFDAAVRRALAGDDREPKEPGVADPAHLTTADAGWAGERPRRIADPSRAQGTSRTGPFSA